MTKDDNDKDIEPLLSSANYRGPVDRGVGLDSLRKRLVDHQDHAIPYPSKTVGITHGDVGLPINHGLTTDQRGGVLGVLSSAHGSGSSIRTFDNHSSTTMTSVPGPGPGAGLGNAGPGNFGGGNIGGGIRTLDQPLTSHDMASVYKYFMTDDLDQDSRPSSNVNGVLPHSHQTLLTSYQGQKGSEMPSLGGLSKQLLLPSMIPYKQPQQQQQQQRQQQQQQQSYINDNSPNFQPSQSSYGQLHQRGEPNSLSPTTLSSNTENKSHRLHRKSPDTTRNGTPTSGTFNMGERLGSPLTSRTSNHNVDVLLDWTRSLDADMF